MIVRFLTAGEVNSYLDVPFNPPDADSDAFDDEWWSARSAVVSALTGFGVADAYGRGDYCVGESHPVSRGISVVLTSETPLRPELIGALRDALATAPHAYSVHLTDNDYALDLFVEPERVLVGPVAATLLPRLGLSAVAPPHA